MCAFIKGSMKKSPMESIHKSKPEKAREKTLSDQIDHGKNIMVNVKMIPLRQNAQVWNHQCLHSGGMLSSFLEASSVSFT
jgi:hypothetical protein